MKNIKRITAFVLVLVMLMSSFSFAASVSIVSPAANSVVTSDSLLISVKFVDAVSAKITVYEEKIENKTVVTDKATNGAITTRAAVTYKSVDTTNFTTADVKLIAAGKTTDVSGKAICLSDGSQVKVYSDVVYKEAVAYENEKKATSFYTDQLSNVKPGLYKVVVETLNTKGKVVSTTSSLIAVKEKVETQTSTASASIEVQSTGVLKVIQSILKTLFK